MPVGTKLKELSKPDIRLKIFPSWRLENKFLLVGVSKLLILV